MERAFESLVFTFSEDLYRKGIPSFDGSESSYQTASDCSRESDTSLYHLPLAPKAFMDSSIHSEDLQYLCSNRDVDRISLSSTASSTGYPRRPDSGGIPLYMPMNVSRGGSGHSPGSNNSKVSVSNILEIFLSAFKVEE